jgi:hypothetical protein
MTRELSSRFLNRSHHITVNGIKFTIDDILDRLKHDNTSDLSDLFDNMSKIIIGLNNIVDEEIYDANAIVEEFLKEQTIFIEDDRTVSEMTKYLDNICNYNFFIFYQKLPRCICR